MGYLDDKIGTITPELLANLEDRGFDAEAFLGLELGVGVSVKDPEAFAIPFREDGKLVGLQVRNAATFAIVEQLMGPGLFYNLDRASTPELANDPLIVTDRADRCWAAIYAGYARSVAVPTMAVDGSRRALVEQHEALWRDVSEVVLCTADDAAGRALREDLADAFGRRRCRWVRYPKGLGSLSDVLRELGVEAVREAIDKAPWIPIPNIYSMSDLPEPAPNPAFDCGIAGLGEHYRLRRGDLAVFTGVPGSGKSSIVNEIAGRMALKHGWRTVFASFEQRPKPDHRRALRTFHGQKLEIHMSAQERATADQWIERQFRFLVPHDDDETSLDWLLETMEAAVCRFDAQLCVIDPWNELEHVRPPQMSQTEYTGCALRAIKRFAKVHRVHVIIVAHPAKLMRNARGEYPKPTLYDIADSAHWYNKPDVGVVIWRDGPEARRPTQIVVQKSRYHSEIGRPGMIAGIWNEGTGRYTITDDGNIGKPR
jgi:twinkle protein